MGAVEQAKHELEAEAFFAQFVNASPQVIAAVEAERGGDLDALVREDLEYGFWDRHAARRAARTRVRKQQEAAQRMRDIAAATRLERPVESARRAPLTSESVALLPPVRVVRVTGEERAESVKWWATFGTATRRTVYLNRLRREERDRERESRVRLAAARSRAERWRLEQRAFERAQLQEVRAVQAERKRKRVANRWVVISEERALEIALAALAVTPPQARR